MQSPNSEHAYVNYEQIAAVYETIASLEDQHQQQVARDADALLALSSTTTPPDDPYYMCAVNNNGFYHHWLDTAPIAVRPQEASTVIRPSCLVNLDLLDRRRSQTTNYTLKPVPEATTYNVQIGNTLYASGSHVQSYQVAHGYYFQLPLLSGVENLLFKKDKPVPVTISASLTIPSEHPYSFTPVSTTINKQASFDPLPAGEGYYVHYTDRNIVIGLKTAVDGAVVKLGLWLLTTPHNAIYESRLATEEQQACHPLVAATSSTLVEAPRSRKRRRVRQLTKNRRRSTKMQRLRDKLKQRKTKALQRQTKSNRRHRGDSKVTKQKTSAAHLRKKLKERRRRYQSKRADRRRRKQQRRTNKVSTVREARPDTPRRLRKRTRRHNKANKRSASVKRRQISKGDKRSRAQKLRDRTQKARDRLTKAKTRTRERAERLRTRGQERAEKLRAQGREKATKLRTRRDEAVRAARARAADRARKAGDRAAARLSPTPPVEPRKEALLPRDGTERIPPLLPSPPPNATDLQEGSDMDSTLTTLYRPTAHSPMPALEPLNSPVSRFGSSSQGYYGSDGGGNGGGSNRVHFTMPGLLACDD